MINLTPVPMSALDLGISFFLSSSNQIHHIYFYGVVYMAPHYSS